MGLRNGVELFERKTSIKKKKERKTAGRFITHYAEIDLFYPRSSITASLDGAPRERIERCMRLNVCRIGLLHRLL